MQSLYWVVLIAMAVATVLNIVGFWKQRKLGRRYLQLLKKYDLEKYSLDKGQVLDRYFVVKVGNGFIEESTMLSLFGSYSTEFGWSSTTDITEAKKFTSFKEAQDMAEKCGGHIIQYEAMNLTAKEVDHEEA